MAGPGGPRSSRPTEGNDAVYHSTAAGDDRCLARAEQRPAPTDGYRVLVPFGHSRRTRLSGLGGAAPRPYGGGGAGCRLFGRGVWRDTQVPPYGGNEAGWHSSGRAGIAPSSVTAFGRATFPPGGRRAAGGRRPLRMLCRKVLHHRPLIRHGLWPCHLLPTLRHPVPRPLGPWQPGRCLAAPSLHPPYPKGTGSTSRSCPRGVSLASAALRAQPPRGKAGRRAQPPGGRR